MKRPSAFRLPVLCGAAFLFAATLAVRSGAAQQIPEQEQRRVIRVSGLGEVRVAPDQAHLDFAVETFAPTARAAGEQNARLMERVIAALTAAGVPRAAIETRGYNLFPEYAQPERPPVPRAEPVEPQQRIVGYRAMNTVSLRTEDLARVGPLIDTALGAGANRMDGLRFSLRDPEPAQNEALRHATDRARRSAEAIAASLGVRLGAVVEASTVTGIIGPVVQFDRGMAAREMAAAAPTPIQPGEQTVTATVAVVYAIEGA